MKNYGEVVAATREENALFSVLLELTYRCNLDCFFCYNDVGMEGKPLGINQYLALLDDLAAMQVMHLVISGGEPLAHPHVFEIGSRARSLGFVIRLKTNGHALRGEVLEQVLTLIDPFVIELSLHGATAAVHDRQTRVDGSFDRLTQNLNRLVDRGVRTKLNSTLTAWNEHELGAMFDLADNLGVPIQFDPDVTPRDDGSDEPLSIRASQEGLELLLSMQTERAARNPDEPPVMREGDQIAGGPSLTRHCGAGCSSVAIDPFGTVYPCVQWRRSIGSLHEEPITEIWTDRGTLAEIRGLNSLARGSLEEIGDESRIAAFCPGLAEKQTGSPLEMYPGAKARLAAGRKVGLADRREG